MVRSPIFMHAETQTLSSPKKPHILRNPQRHRERPRLKNKMFHKTNCCFLFFNILAFISGCMSLGFCLYFRSNHGVTDCQKEVLPPFLVMGVFLFVTSLIGIIGTCFRIPKLIWVYSFVALLALIVLTILTIFSYVVSDPNNERFLNKVIKDEKPWREIRRCFAQNQICKKLDSIDIQKPPKSLSPVVLNCCKPPTKCGFQHKNGTVWEAPTKPIAPELKDCTTWSNEKNRLCFDCEICKDEVVIFTRLFLRLLAIIETCDVVVLLLIFFLSCCTRSNIKNDKYRMQPLRY